MSTISSYSACRYYKGGTLQSTSSPGYYGWDGTSGNWVTVLTFSLAERDNISNVEIPNMYRAYGDYLTDIKFKITSDYSSYVNAGSGTAGDGTLSPVWGGTYYSGTCSCNITLAAGTYYLVLFPASSSYCVYGYTGSNLTPPLITYAAAPFAYNMQVKIGGVYKPVTKIQVKVGGAWKTVTKLQVKVGGAWKTSG